MKKYIFILLSIIVFGQNVQSSDSTKVQILLNLYGNVIKSEPEFTNISGINYYSSESFPGLGFGGDVSVFFTKNIGVEVGLSYQNIPSKISVEVPVSYIYGIYPVYIRHRLSQL
jgi:hypothetical protein